MRMYFEYDNHTASSIAALRIHIHLPSTFPAFTASQTHLVRHVQLLHAAYSDPVLSILRSAELQPI